MRCGADLGARGRARSAAALVALAGVGAAPLPAVAAPAVDAAPAAGAAGVARSRPGSGTRDAGALRITPAAPSLRWLAGLGVGRGLRLDNPYRLQTVLGDDARSLSLSATYLDVWIGGLVEAAPRLHHGVVVHGSIATDGIGQEVVAPAYAVLRELSPRWALLGRVGLPVVIEPDLNAGFEVAAGGLLYATAGVAVSATVVGSLFYGAATLDTPRTAIPMLSLEVGVAYDHEVLR